MLEPAKTVVAMLVFMAVASTGCEAWAISDCVYAGVTFSDGAVSCQSGNQFQCSDGDWKSLDLSCQAPPPPPTVTNPADCVCTEAELRNCQAMGQLCCVSLAGGACAKKCCPAP